MPIASFGQVVFPASRAVDEFSADDFDESVPNPYEIDLIKNSPVGQVKTILFAIGLHPSNFVDVYVLAPKSVTNFSFNVYRNKDLTEGRKPKPCFTLHGFYIAETKSLIVTTRSFIDPQISFELNKKLFDLLGPTTDLQVYVMDSKSDAYYYGPDGYNHDEGPFIRKIGTSKFHAQILEKEVKPMKIPNMLDGFSAAVISHCEFNNILAVGFIVVTRAATFDVDSTNLFRILRKIPELSSVIKESNEATKAALMNLNKNSISFYA